MAQAAICECGGHVFASLKRENVVLVSPEDRAILGELWHVHKRGYVQNATGKLHRKILNAPTGLLVDHINHDKLDCRRANLRLVTAAQSVRNRRKLRRRSQPASRYIGVHRNGAGWIARISIRGKRRSAGTFPTQEEAARAYDRAAQKYVGEYAQLNFGGIS